MNEQRSIQYVRPGNERFAYFAGWPAFAKRSNDVHPMLSLNDNDSGGCGRARVRLFRISFMLIGSLLCIKLNYPHNGR